MKMKFKWLVARLRLFFMLLRAVFKNSRKLELKLQGFRQQRENLSHANKRFEYMEMKGFCSGIEYFLDGKWEGIFRD